MAEKVKGKKKIVQVIGTAGFYVLLAVIFEGFSIDSFAMPYWWISLGLAVSIQEKKSPLEMAHKKWM